VYERVKDKNNPSGGITTLLGSSCALLPVGLTDALQSSASTNLTKAEGVWSKKGLRPGGILATEGELAGRTKEKQVKWSSSVKDWKAG